MEAGYGKILPAIVILLTSTIIHSEEWEQTGCPTNQEGQNLAIYDLAVWGDTIFCGTIEGVWRSVDNGAEWEPIGLAVEVDGRPCQVNDLLVHDETLYAAADQVYRYLSENEWEQIGSIDYGCNNPKMTIAKMEGHLFANIPQCNGKGLYKSANTAGDWSKVSDPGKLIVWSDGEIMYAGRKYTTDGENWSSVQGVKGGGAIYDYATTNGRYYLGAYTITGTDAASISEDGKNFSAFSKGLWRNTTTSSLTSYGDTVFCFAHESDYLDNRTNYVQWADGESTRWTKLGGPLYMAYDRSSLLVHRGWLYAACNGTEFRKLEDGYERIGGYGIWRFVLDEESVHTAMIDDAVSNGPELRVTLSQSGRMIYLVTGPNAALASGVSLSLYTGQGRLISHRRIDASAFLGGVASEAIPPQAHGVVYYSIRGLGSQKSCGRLCVQ